VHDVDARFDGKPARSMEIIRFDSSKRQFFARSYDDQRTVEEFLVALNGRRWSIKGTAVRFNGSFDAKKNRLKGLWELRGAKSGWKPWTKLELARA
jgi:hypothetical protein